MAKPQKNNAIKKTAREKEAPAPLTKPEPEPPKEPQQNSLRETGGPRLRDLESQPSKPKPRRFSFNVDDEGKIAWEGMKDGNRGELKAVLMADPELRAALSGDAADDEITFSPDDVKEILCTLNDVNKTTTGFVFSRLRKWPIESAVLDWAFQMPPKHPELASRFDTVCERGSKVANKHLPGFLKKYMNEILFISGYLQIVKLQVGAAVNMQNQRNQKQQQAADNGENTEARTQANGAAAN